jgi:3D (Asp-Asp-Asp) domain-containing protein
MNLSFKVYQIRKTFEKKGFMVIIFAIFIAIFCLPKFSSWAFYQINTSNYYNKLQHVIRINSQPKIETNYYYVTAYNSTVGQTDSTPCITASGYDLCKHDIENVVACNFLPFGTKIKFPELDPDQIYTVVDRMHGRYQSRIDIWKKSVQEASQFGVQYLKVEIFK